MKKCTFIAALLILCVGVLESCTSRRVVGLEQGWDVLDERKVNFIRDVDAIEVKSRNPYTAIRFKVEEKDVRINYLRVQFDNGDVLEPAIDDVIAAGEWSRIIEISREGRVINTIQFRYRSLGNVLTGRANVITTARRYDPYRIGN